MLKWPSPIPNEHGIRPWVRVGNLNGKWRGLAIHARHGPKAPSVFGAREGRCVRANTPDSPTARPVCSKIPSVRRAIAVVPELMISRWWPHLVPRRSDPWRPRAESFGTNLQKCSDQTIELCGSFYNHSAGGFPGHAPEVCQRTYKVFSVRGQGGYDNQVRRGQMRLVWRSPPVGRETAQWSGVDTQAQPRFSNSSFH